MIVVIIAGGSGTRLWPLSTHNFPKHLLKLTNDRSLLQNTFDRVLSATSIDKIFIVTEDSHVGHVRSQLPELDNSQILTEPARRGTANCVVYALCAIKKCFKTDEPVLFLWADHLIHNADGFVASVLRAADLCKEQNKLVFMGITPTYPSTGFGYMEKGAPIAKWQQAFELKKFREKPDKKTAEKYVGSGKYLWNTGYLTGLMSVYEREMKENAPTLWNNYQALLTEKDINKKYLEFKNEPIDTALSEKVGDAVMIPGSFDWADVGSFQDLYSVSLQDDDGNHISGDGVALENTTNSYVRNEMTQPLAVIGLDGVVVVANDNGILIVNKNYTQKVGDVAKRIQAV